MGALVAVYLRIPLGAIMGALTATVVVQSLGLTSVEPFPPWARNILYAAIGFMIGLRITRSSLRQLRGVALPALLVPAVMILCGLLLGSLLFFMAPDDSPLRLDLKTAVLAVTPGGFQEMTIAAHRSAPVRSLRYDSFSSEVCSQDSPFAGGLRLSEKPPIAQMIVG